MSDKIVQLKDKDGTAIFPLSAYGSTEFVGAGASTAGTKGIVPAPAAGDQNKFLKADGTWAAAVSYETATGSNVNPDDRYAPLTTGVSVQDGAALTDAQCIFNFTNIGGDNQYETKIFANAKITDPIGGGTIYGVTETKEYISDGNLYIEQTFKRKQYGTINKQYVFQRLGYIQSWTGNKYTDVTSATITWQEWIPIEYPRTAISPSWVESGFTIHSYSYFVINGGIATLSLNEIKYNANISGTYTKAITLPFKAKNDGYMYLFALNENSGIATYRINMDARNEIGCYKCSANTIYRPYWQIPLGY